MRAQARRHFRHDLLIQKVPGGRQPPVYRSQTRPSKSGSRRIHVQKKDALTRALARVRRWIRRGGTGPAGAEAAVSSQHSAKTQVHSEDVQIREIFFFSLMDREEQIPHR